MLSKSFMLLLRLFRRLGVRVVLMTAAAVLSALVAPFIDPFLPQTLKQRFSQEAVLPILTILASTMLAATTFSLGVMVSAFQAASGQATPRAYRILMQDGTTQNVLATFVSAFLFSLTAIVMFRADFYGPSAAVVVFGLTVLTIVLIIGAILRWIDHLTRLGSMDHTLRMVENAAAECLRSAARAPCLGARPLDADSPPPSGSQPIQAPTTGYVQFINMPRLHEALERDDARIWITAPPGFFVLKGAPVGQMTGGTAATGKAVAKQFVIGRERTLEQDVRFGIVVLTEIATRALSPGVNDPGTAIDVIRRQQALLWEHAGNLGQAPEVRYPRARVPRVTAQDLTGDAFGVIIRDGAGRIEVMRALLQALGALATSDLDALSQAAEASRRYAVDHARAALSLEADRDAIAALIDEGSHGQRG